MKKEYTLILTTTEEKLKEWKNEIEKSRNTRHYEDETFESGRRIGMEEIISDIEDILYK